MKIYINGNIKKTSFENVQWTDLVEGLSGGELWKHGLEFGVWQKKWISRSSGEVSMSEENFCTVNVIILVSCHMWVEGD